MLYTIAQAAKAMAVEQSIILKAIQDGHITGTKDVSGEWHIEDVELNLLYLYLARNYCKQQLQTDAQKIHASSQEPQIISIAGGRVEQERRDARRGADPADAAPIMPAMGSTWQDEIRIDGGDRISASASQPALQTNRVRLITAAVSLSLGCTGAGSLYFLGRIPVLEQNARPLTAVVDSEKANTPVPTVVPRPEEKIVSNVVSAGVKNVSQERSSPPAVTQHVSAPPQSATKKDPAKARRNPAPVPETRPITIPGWTVRNVVNGIATLDGPEGTWKVARGDTVPVLGKIDSVVLWGNRWIVATSKGLITTP